MANALEMIVPVLANGKKVGYVRVSTVKQNTERQLAGLTLDKVFEDKASGKDTNRPALRACMDYLREDDRLFVHSMDRLARSVEDMLTIIKGLTERGVTVTFIKENLTFSNEANPMNRLMLTLLASFAEFERNLMRERQREGIEIAKTKGVYKGRKPVLSGDKLTLFYARIDRGDPKAVIAREMGISRQSIYEYLANRKPTQEAQS